MAAYLQYLCLFFLYIANSNSTSELIVKKVSHPVTFASCCQESQNKDWKFGEHYLFFNWISVPENPVIESVSLGFDHSLHIKSVTVSHEGIYLCICDDYAKRNYSLKVEVPPRMVIWTYKDTDQVTEEQGKNLTVTCSALGGRPPVKINWFLNGKHLQPIWVTVTNSSINGTYDTESQVCVDLSYANGTISCESNPQLTSSSQIVEITYVTYVPPTAIMIVNGNEVDDLIYIGDDMVNITCYATYGRPGLKLIWYVNGELVTGSGYIKHRSRESGGTYEVVEVLYFQANNTNGYISCGTHNHLGNSVNITVRYAVKQEQPYIVAVAKDSMRQSNTLIYTIAIPGGLLFFVVVVTSAFRRHKDTSSSLLEVPSLTQQTSALEEEEMTLTVGCTPEYKKPPCVKLPAIPKNEFNEENENVYCLTLDERAPTHGKIFHAKDMRLILNMKSSYVYNRWMGTIKTADNKTQCVLLTTVKDNNDLHWDDFVKRLLEIPESIHIPSAEGICIDGAHMYLVQEYFDCATLHTRLTGNTKMEALKDGMKSIFDIIDGMEFIHSYGFLHPGLTTQKILVTEEGVCKIYDFCLSRDSVKRLLERKRKGNYSLNDFPLESLHRNEYTWASDTWCVAVVLWQIMCDGKLPFTSDKVTGDNCANDLLSQKELLWNENTSQIRNDVLLACWSVNTSERPTLRMLKSSFVQLDNYNFQMESMSTDDSYVPMSGGKRGIEGHYSYSICQSGN